MWASSYWSKLYWTGYYWPGLGVTNASVYAGCPTAQFFSLNSTFSVSTIVQATAPTALIRSLNAHVVRHRVVSGIRTAFTQVIARSGGADMPIAGALLDEDKKVSGGIG
jgi:hypothetical protein